MPIPENDSRSSRDPAPTSPPRQTEEEIEHTINDENEVDEASLESFPASDPPAFAGRRFGAEDAEDAADEEE